MQQNLVRTYLERVAGRLEESFYNSTSKQFTASYYGNVGGQSVLFVGKERIYNNSFSINVFPENEVSLS